MDSSIDCNHKFEVRAYLDGKMHVRDVHVDAVQRMVVLVYDLLCFG